MVKARSWAARPATTRAGCAASAAGDCQPLHLLTGPPAPLPGPAAWERSPLAQHLQQAQEAVLLRADLHVLRDVLVHHGAAAHLQAGTGAWEGVVQAATRPGAAWRNRQPMRGPQVAMPTAHLVGHRQSTGRQARCLRRAPTPPFPLPSPSPPAPGSPPGCSGPAAPAPPPAQSDTPARARDNHASVRCINCGVRRSVHAAKRPKCGAARRRLQGAGAGPPGCVWRTSLCSRPSMQSRPCAAAHLAREGGREHDSLAVGPDVLHDAHDLRLKAHVEHAVSLVQNLSHGGGQQGAKSGLRLVVPTEYPQAKRAFLPHRGTN